MSTIFPVVLLIYISFEFSYRIHIFSVFYKINKAWIFYILGQLLEQVNEYTIVNVNSTLHWFDIANKINHLKLNKSAKTMSEKGYLTCFLYKKRAYIKLVQKWSLLNCLITIYSLTTSCCKLCKISSSVFKFISLDFWGKVFFFKHLLNKAYFRGFLVYSFSTMYFIVFTSSKFFTRFVRFYFKFD